MIESIRPTPADMSTLKPALYLAFASLILASCASQPGGRTAEGATAAYFVVMGDNRLGAKDRTPDDPSTANVAQLRQNLADIAALRPRPSFIFFTGDLVDNEADDHGETLKKQLDAWTTLYRELARECGLEVPLIPIPGNHELMRFVRTPTNVVEMVNPYTYPVWNEWLKRSGFGRFSGRGPTDAAPNQDLLSADNRGLTYSFDDDHGDHFIVINTYTMNNQKQPPSGWIPLAWIVDDVQRAEKNPGVRRIFAFAHEPIEIGAPPAFDPTGMYCILNTTNYPLAQSLLAAFSASTKFGGYFGSHMHLWDCGMLPNSQGVWQLVAGNAGAPPITQPGGMWQPPFWFGFTVARVYREGPVGVTSYNRPIPTPFNSTNAQPAALPMPEIRLWRSGPNAAGTTAH